MVLLSMPFYYLVARVLHEFAIQVLRVLRSMLFYYLVARVLHEFAIQVLSSWSNK